MDWEIPRSTSSGDSDYSSRAASLFSVGASSTTSISSVATVSDDWVQSFINALFLNEDVTLLSTAAIRDRSIGYDRYRRNLRRLLMAFGANLRREAFDKKEKLAGNILQMRASIIADQVAQKADPNIERFEGLKDLPKESLGDKLFRNLGHVTLPVTHVDVDKEPSDASDGVSSGSDMEVDNSEEDGFEEFAPLRDFILASGAYRTFLENLAVFVRLNYVKPLGKIIDVIGDDTTSSLQDLRGFIFERTWLSRHEVRFSRTETPSLEDQMKGLVEYHLAERWDWWPLRPRSLPLQEGYTRVYWRCGCGEQRFADLEASVASELQLALQPTPSWIKLLPIKTPAVGPANIPRTSAPSTNAPSRHAAGALPQNNAPPSGSGIPGASAAPVTTTAGTGPQGISPPPATISEHVFLGARRGLDLRIADLQVQSMNDEEFFRRLEHDYKQLRGRLRLWLSWWRFDGCEFFRFEKFAEDEFVPRIVDFPHIANLEYRYMPRPIDPRPPISKHEFRKRYYNSCGQPSSWHRPWHSCKKFCSRRSQALGVIPKRVRVLETGGDAREDFWGILAQERRYFVWVLGYFLLTLLPSIVFFFMWLFRWSHVNDLQNASVPITMTLGLWAVFATVLWQDRAVVWED
ncbi:hypothetical protein LTS10_009553 [Elasticomyces elasticus]|nr:hypothetical protein LTS10_009553 [Elasticomyces elasticus]